MLLMMVLTMVRSLLKSSKSLIGVPVCWLRHRLVVFPSDGVFGRFDLATLAVATP